MTATRFSCALRAPRPSRALRAPGGLLGSLAHDALVQLAARGVSITASRVAHRDVQALTFHHLLEAADRSAVRGAIRSVLDRVERDEVHMCELASQQPAQLLSVALGVVDAGQQHPFITDPASRLVRVTLGGADQVLEGVLAV